MKEQESNNLFKPVETLRASEAIYKQISEKILAGELQPGDRLPSERAMMDLFQRSRPSIREALRMLERNGLVQIIPGTRGALVTTPGSSTISESLQNLIMMESVPEKDLLECRENTELQAALWACERRTPEQLIEMKEIIDPLNEKTDIETIIESDLMFHKLIAKASHNKVMQIVNSVLHQVVWTTLRDAYEKKDAKGKRLMIKEILSDHAEIYNCIEKQDQKKCRTVIENHMRKFENDLL